MDRPPLDRRDFLKILGFGLALPTLSQAAAAAAKKRTPLPSCGLVLMPMMKRLGILDTPSGKYREVAIPNASPHCALPYPDGRHALVIDQVGGYSTLVDLRAGKVAATAGPTIPSYLFSGHGCISADSKTLFVPEFSFSQMKESPGKITQFDPITLKPLRQLTAHGIWSHNVAFTNDEKTLVLSHRGRKPSPDLPMKGSEVNFLRVSDGEILEVYRPDDPNWFLSHFDLDADDTIVASSQSFYSDGKTSAKEETVELLSPVLIGKQGRKNWDQIFPPEISQNMKHNHSIKIDRARKRAVVAHSKGGIVSVWDLPAHKLLHTIPLENPLGVEISPDGKFYLLGNTARDLLFVEPDTFTTRHFVPGSKFGSGAGPQHLSLAIDK